MVLLLQKHQTITLEQLSSIHRSMSAMIGCETSAGSASSYRYLVVLERGICSLRWLLCR